MGDAEAVVEKTKAAGGSILMPATTMPEVGTFAVLRDPQGVVFAPLTPTAGPEGEVETATPGCFCWRELYTTDQEAAFALHAKAPEKGDRA